MISMWPFNRKPKQIQHSLSPDIIRLIDVLSGLIPSNNFGAPPPLTMPSFITGPPLTIHSESPEAIEQRKKETAEVDAFITKMEPDIQTQTQALIKEEIRDMLLLGGNRQRILELLRLGKTPRLVRKKEGRRDPLFLQFGDGIQDPIEEMQILG